MKIYAIIIAILFCVCRENVNAQVDNILSKYGGENAGGFVQPLADAFTANLNSGLYQNGFVPLSGLHISVGVVLLGAPVSESRRTFTGKTEGFFNPPQTAQAPSIFGSTEGTSVRGNGGTVYVFPGGLDVKLFSLAAPQITIGSLYGTEAMLRFFQVKIGKTFGTLRLFGFGLRHNITQYLKLKDVPLDFAAGIYYQNFGLGDIISGSGVLVSGQASYKTGVLTLYGGPGFEFSSMKVEYNGSAGKVSTSVSAANKVRFTLGAAATLIFFRLHADYNLSSQSTFALGFSFVF